MSTSSYKPQKGRGLPWPLDTDAPSVADQAETPSEMEAALDVRQDEIVKSEILSGLNRPNRKDANGKELTKGLFMRQDKLEKKSVRLNRLYRKLWASWLIEASS